MPSRPHLEREPNELWYMGIDPGKTGGISVVSASGLHAECHVMPETPLDLWLKIDELVTNYKIKFALMELVHSMPKDSSKGAFTFGMNFGMLQGILSAIETVPWGLNTPLTWQRGLRIKGRGKKEAQDAFKNRLRLECQRRFPSLSIWREPRSKTKQLAVCDSLLIAEYARQKHEGLLG